MGPGEEPRLVLGLNGGCGHGWDKYAKRAAGEIVSSGHS